MRNVIMVALIRAAVGTMKVMDVIGHTTGRSSLDCIKERIEPPS